MFRYLILIALLCASVPVCAADKEPVEVALFQEVCREINRQYEDFLLKQQMTDVFLVEDPITGEQMIVYKGKDRDNVPVAFKQLGLQRQLAVLRAGALPVFPLPDTLVIVDTLKFFPDGLGWQAAKAFFKVSRKPVTKTASADLMYLNQVGNMRRNRYGDRFWIAFAFAKPGCADYTADYYFTIDAGLYKISRSYLYVGSECTGG